MKIALPHCGFSPESNSGGETYEREILKALARLGVEFEIILAKGKPYPQGYPEFHVHELPVRRGLRWYVSNFVWPHALKQIQKNGDFDLLRIHSLRYTGPGVLWFNQLSKKKYPIVCHHHHIDPSPLNLLIEKQVIEHSHVLITGSQFSKRQLIHDFHISGDKIKVVPYGVDEKFVPGQKDSPLIQKYDLAGKKVLLFLAGLKKRKKVFFLIDIFEQLKKQTSHPLKLLIVGSGPLKIEIEKYIASKKLERDIILTGYIPENDKLKYYRTADVFVFPSEMEGFGFSPAEASACGKPVVASDSGSLPEIVENEVTGFCVPNERKAFAEKIMTLINNETLGWRLGEAGERRVASMFRWEIAARKTFEIYQDLIKNYDQNI